MTQSAFNRMEDGVATYDATVVGRRRVGHVFLVALLLAAAWTPAIMYAAPGCFGDGRITSSGTWPIQSDGYHHIKVQVGSQDGFVMSAIDHAIDEWNAQKNQTKVVFDVVDGTGFTGTPDLVFHGGDTSANDPCAYEIEPSSTGPAEIWFNNLTDGVVDAAHDNYTLASKLFEHEMGHFLLMDDVHGKDPSTIMTNYDFNDPGVVTCEDAMNDAGYPGDLGGDANNVVNCLKSHQSELPGGGGPGDGDAVDSEYDPGYGGYGCEEYWAIPEYEIDTSSYSSGSTFYLSTTVTLIGYDFIDMGPIDCGAGYPLVYP